MIINSRYAMFIQFDWKAIVRKRLCNITLIIILAMSLAAQTNSAAAQEAEETSLFESTPQLIGNANDRALSIAWGDVDNDGDLDLAVGNNARPLKVYKNVDGQLTGELFWSDSYDSYTVTKSVAWGDVDNDGDLDLAVADNRATQIFENIGDTLTQEPIWYRPGGRHSMIAWGDVDGDGDLDLAIGRDGSTLLYENQNGRLASEPIWSEERSSFDYPIAWGDADNDGDLDLAVAGEYNVVYENQSGRLTNTILWADDNIHTDDNAYSGTSSIAWGDVDNDGDLDLTIGRTNGRITINENRGGQLSEFPISLSSTPIRVEGMEWGDVDGDDDLDLVVSTREGVDILENQDGILTESKLWSDFGRSKVISNIETVTVALGDVDNDGDLDLAVLESLGASYLYKNSLQGLRDRVMWSTADMGGLAWGDVDNDGDLDLAIGGSLYQNDDGALSAESIWSDDLDEPSASTAWGDVDNDGDLDLVVGYYRSRSTVYENQGGELSKNAIWLGSDHVSATAWGDVDNDGDLDLAVGSYYAPYSSSRVYENQDGQLSPNILWSGYDKEYTSSIAWGDIDNDGDLDLVEGNSARLLFGGFYIAAGSNSKVYENQGGTLSEKSFWSTGDIEGDKSVALVDIDNDGDLELSIGNEVGLNIVYENHDSTFQTSALWAQPAEGTETIAWGDTDNDGDLDLFMVTHTTDELYKNQNGQLATSPTFSIPTLPNYDSSEEQRGIPSKRSSFGDIDNDGDLDLAVSRDLGDDSYLTYVYENVDLNSPRFGPVFDEISLTQNLYDVRVDQSVAISYSLFSHLGQTVPRVVAEYKVDNKGPWKRAIATSDTITKNLAAFSYGEEVSTVAPSPIDENLTQQTYLPFMPGGVAYTQGTPQPASHIFKWDLAATNLAGSSDHVVVRLVAYPACVNSCQRAQVVAQTHPFRVRGQTLRVMQNSDDGSTQPAVNALVYKAAEGTDKFEPLTNSAGIPLRTNRQGYVVGQLPIAAGDKLVAALPVSPSVPLTSTEGITTTVTLTQLLYTSAAITEVGLDAYVVDSYGAHELTVSADNPLLLFNLAIALEWDARNDEAYMQRLEDNIQRTSEILYDLTGGQAALGDVGIYHDKGLWGYADIAITARNTQRPSAILGGSVLTRTTEVLGNGTEVTYLPGQIRMPPEWNKFDDPQQSRAGDDWAQVLAHELGHYLFRLPDNYLGTQDGILTLVDCEGSVMTNPYILDYSEFLTRDESWRTSCENTLANRFLGRTDWESIRQVYPFLSEGNLNSGPSTLPLEVTRIEVFAPETEPNTLTEVEFFLKDEQDNRVTIPKGQGQAYLLTRRPGLSPEDLYEYVIDLGRPVTDKVIARGASVGDRLCVFDSSVTSRYGCMNVGDAATSLTMRPITDWTPDVRLTPVSSNTISVSVFNVPQASLSAQLLPAAGRASAVVPMIAGSDGFSVTLSAPDGAYYGFVRLCSPDCTDAPERESVVEFVNRAEWGGQGFAWGGQGFAWGGQGFAWGGQGFAWGGQGYQWNAPVMSADGQVSVFPLDDVFGENSDFTLQRLDHIPSLYSWLTPVGQAYRFEADRMPSNASLLFNYLAGDAPPLSESGLSIYFSDDNGNSWQRLETELNTTLNLASTLMPGIGTYVLAATEEMTPLQMGCNLIGYPLKTTRTVNDALASVDGSYTTVWGHVNGLWSIHDSTVEAPFDELVNTLKGMSTGQAYFIYATEPITPYLPVDLEGVDVVQSAAADQINTIATPATYYGWLTPTEGFSPSIGSTVTVESNGQLLGQTTVIELDGQLAYVVQVNPIAISDCGPTEHELLFRIDGQLMDHNRLWDNSQAWSQPLSTVR